MIKSAKNKAGRKEREAKKEFYSAYCPVCGYERLLEKGRRASCPEHNRLLIARGM